MCFLLSEWIPFLYYSEVSDGFWRDFKEISGRNPPRCLITSVGQSKANETGVDAFGKRR